MLPFLETLLRVRHSYLQRLLAILLASIYIYLATGINLRAHN